ncbi:MAG TPA: hypothetical protein P5560_09160 [Thermotogota bacterium]|nr:hypothetical protein [Thermotogota bacterium]HRW93100.1 hypothetical protein [Thermotogota bacterium]
MKRSMAFVGFFLLGIVVLGCSSFMVNTDRVWIGSNFDYPNELEYRVAFFASQMGHAYFAIQFSRLGNLYYTALGMNDQGYFANLQNVPTRVLENMVPGKENLPIQDFLLYQLSFFSEVSQTREALEEYRLVNFPGYASHTMAVDAKGDALIVEPGFEDNQFFRFEGDYWLMTNFYMADLARDRLYYQYDRRFNNMEKKIQEYKEEMDLEKAFAILSAAFQFETQISSVYDPQSGEVFFALHRNLDKIFKLRLQDGTLQTFQGFRTQREITLSSSGITFDELESWE